MVSSALPTTVSVLADLVAFDTTSVRSNLALIDYVESFLASYGIPSWRAPNAAGDKASLWATLGPEIDGGLVLSGHSDCVPVEGQAWSSDPFTLTERNGNLYARGSTDMKGFVASALTTMAALAGTPRTTPLHLALSYDEELGCSGVGGLLAELNRRRIRPAACLVGEPTLMQVITGHKGGRAYRVTVTGLEAHSSLTPQGVNAIEFAAAIIGHIRAVALGLANGPSDADYDVPFSTISTGFISGGTAINIVPNRCDFVFEFRNLAEIDQDAIFAGIEQFVRTQIEPAMHAVSPATGVKFEQLYDYPAQAIASDHPLVTQVKSLLGNQAHSKVAFGTEAGLFQRDLGVPTVICGPGSIAVAHKPNEYVSLDQLAACDAFLAKVCRPSGGLNAAELLAPS